MGLKRGEVNLYVTDLERSARFYEAGLGMSECESDTSYRKLHRDDVTLTLFVAKEGGRAAPPGTRPSMTCDLHVDDLDGVVASLRAAGAEVSEIRTWEGGRWTDMLDPDGIGWEFLEP